VAPPTIPTKADLRARALAARLAMTATARDVAGAAISRAVLDAAEVSTARTVAAYLSFGTEPATQHLVEDLRSRGVRVLVPVLRRDLDLDWTEYGDKTGNAHDTAHWSTPSGPRLGLDAIAGADVVLVPALAVDQRGMRLGRGGGSYDRALARVPPARPVFALLYDGECPVAVPVEPHDRPVTAVVTPREVLRFA
jgi:5-formyltetrahydrofolate cyclo-ligase